MDFKHENDALENALEIVNNARIDVVDHNHAAWLFLRRVTDRLKARQVEVFTANFS